MWLQLSRTDDTGQTPSAFAESCWCCQTISEGMAACICRVLHTELHAIVASVRDIPARLELLLQGLQYWCMHANVDMDPFVEVPEVHTPSSLQKKSSGLVGMSIKLCPCPCFRGDVFSHLCQTQSGGRLDAPEMYVLSVQQS